MDSIHGTRLSSRFKVGMTMLSSRIRASFISVPLVEPTRPGLFSPLPRESRDEQPGARRSSCQATENLHKGTGVKRHQKNRGGENIVVLCRSLPDHTKSSGELRFWQILRHLRRRARSLTVFAETFGNRDLFPDLTVHPTSAL